MADFTNTKSSPGVLYPEHADATPWGRLEPLVTPDQLTMRQLFGVPLVSHTVNPFTRKVDVITPEMLKEYIRLAVNEVELETSLVIMPTQFTEKLPYDKQDFDQFAFLQLNHTPVASIQQLSIRIATEDDIFVYPLEWIETANLSYGQINMIPLAWEALSTSNAPVPGEGIVGYGAGTVFFNNVFNRDWVSALVNCQYTAGFPDGLVPTVVNELIGIVAAMRVLSLVAATNARTNSQSLGVDGLSQSVSGPGAQVFAQRLQELQQQREAIKKKLRASMNSSFVITAL